MREIIHFIGFGMNELHPNIVIQEESFSAPGTMPNQATISMLKKILPE